MNVVVDIVRVLVDESVGNRGAVRNCRSELASRRDGERQVEALRCRLDGGEPTGETGERAGDVPATA